MEKQTIMKQLNDINKMINGGHIEEAIHLLNQLVSTSSPRTTGFFTCGEMPTAKKEISNKL